MREADDLDYTQPDPELPRCVLCESANADRTLLDVPVCAACEQEWDTEYAIWDSYRTLRAAGLITDDGPITMPEVCA